MDEDAKCITPRWISKCVFDSLLLNGGFPPFTSLITVCCHCQRNSNRPFTLAQCLFSSKASDCTFFSRGSSSRFVTFRCAAEPRCSLQCWRMAGVSAQWRASACVVNLLAAELFFLILAHPVCRMWIIQEPNMLELRNELHFEEEKTESLYHV